MLITASHLNEIFYAFIDFLSPCLFSFPDQGRADHPRKNWQCLPLVKLQLWDIQRVCLSHFAHKCPSSPLVPLLFISEVLWTGTDGFFTHRLRMYRTASQNPVLCCWSPGRVGGWKHKGDEMSQLPTRVGGQEPGKSGFAGRPSGSGEPLLRRTAILDCSLAGLLGRCLTLEEARFQRPGPWPESPSHGPSLGIDNSGLGPGTSDFSVPGPVVISLGHGKC